MAVIVGSAETQEKYGSQAGDRFTPMSAVRQRAAVKFLNENAFATPTYLLDADILRRIEPEGSIQRINGAQRGVLSTLFSDIRLSRLISFEATAKPGEAVYAAADLLADVRGGVWTELSSGSVKIDAYRRALQTSYLDLARSKVNPQPINLGPIPAGIPASFIAQLTRRSADAKALFRAELKTLDGQLAAAQAKAGNAITKAHLAEARHEIDDILNPKK